MVLPEFDVDGNLPAGIHRATLLEVLQRFGHGSSQRRSVADRLARIHQLACSTSQVARFVVFGSFITAKEDPNDVDIILVMFDGFDLSSVSGEAALVFQHAEADAHFGASVFWARRASVFGGEQSMIEYWQTRREGGQRGIIEIISEEP